MCGISGYLNTNNQLISSNAINRKMLLMQRHRGPDDSGICAFSLRNKIQKALPTESDEEIDGFYEGILGFNRLSILDVSLNGHQPMISDDNMVILTLNGEVYNVFDYKMELENSGYHFKGTSDTEVVLALYLKYGLEKMLDLINGMYAMVIVDLRKSDLYIIRDRFGVKPMYYIHQDDLFAFSSEYKSFKGLNNFKFELDRGNLDEYLLFRSNVRGTLVKGINVLEPGHYLEYNVSDGLRDRVYFDINYYSRKHKEPANFKTKAQYKEELAAVLLKSVKYQLISDVKLGCQLSGGIDSSLVSYMANKIDNGKMFETVSITLDDKDLNEEKYIDYVANKLNVESHKFLLDPYYFSSNLEKITWHFEAPIGHPNSIGIYLLAQRAKQYVTVLLSGEGADEVFGGYSHFFDIKYPFSIKHIINNVKRYIAILFKNIIKKHKYLLSIRIIPFISPMRRSIMASAFMPLYLAKAIVKDFNYKNAVWPREKLYKKLTGSVFDKQIKYDIKTYLPDLCVRQDKMTMAHSVENRVPFLDYKVVEHSFSIPEQFLVNKNFRNGTGKALLKEIAADVFDADFAFRPKCGFGLPLKNLFMDREMIRYLHDIILPSIKRRGIMNYKLVSKWINDIPKMDFAEIECSLWIVVSFEIWAMQYLD